MFHQLSKRDPEGHSPWEHGQGCSHERSRRLWQLLSEQPKRTERTSASTENPTRKGKGEGLRVTGFKCGILALKRERGRDF